MNCVVGHGAADANAWARPASCVCVSKLAAFSAPETAGTAETPETTETVARLRLLRSRCIEVTGGIANVARHSVWLWIFYDPKNMHLVGVMNISHVVNIMQVSGDVFVYELEHRAHILGPKENLNVVMTRGEQEQLVRRLHVLWQVRQVFI